MARPMPRDPPVTTALLPDRSIMERSPPPSGAGTWKRSGRDFDAWIGQLRPLGLSGHDVVEWRVDVARTGHQLRQRGRDRIDRVPVDRQSNMDIVGAELRVGFSPPS